MCRNEKVLLIDQNGTRLGVVSIKEAKEKAEEYNLDLVCINDKEVPNIYKIMDYDKYRFENEKKPKHRAPRNKELKINPQIEQHDINTKIKSAKKFLTKGNRVKISMRFKGRQILLDSLGKQKLNDFINVLKEFSNVEKTAEVKGGSITTLEIYLAPKSKKN